MFRQSTGDRSVGEFENMEIKLPSFSSYRGLSRDAKYLIYQSILPAVAFGMFYTDVAYFLTTVQGLTYDFMGAVVTTMGISTFVAAVPLGLLADRYGRRKMLVVGNVIAAAIIAAFAFTTNPLALLTAAVFEGISEAAFSASSGALLAENAEDAKKKQRFLTVRFCSEHLLRHRKLGDSSSHHLRVPGIF